MILRKLLHIFFVGPLFTFSMGCRCPLGDTVFLFTARFGGLLGDEKALKGCFELKGASGSKPCAFCKNVVGKRSEVPHNDGYFVCVDCSRYCDLDPHTNESILAMADKLTAQHLEGGSKGKFKVLEQALGLSFSPHGILFDQQLRMILKPRENILWDWMHCLLSGGIVPLEIAKFVSLLVEQGISVGDLDEFCSKVHGVQGLKSDHMPGDFFKTRWHGDSIKCFAKEIMSVLGVLGFFVQLTLVPHNLLAEHTACLQLLCLIVDFVAIGDVAVQHVSQLRNILERHQHLFNNLYGPESSIPKNHYCLHVPDVMEAQGCNMSSFVVERKHRCAKRIANRTFNAFEHTLACDVFAHHMQSFLHNPALMRPAYLANPHATPWAIDLFKESVPGVITEVYGGPWVQLKSGHRREHSTDFNFETVATIGGQLLSP